MKIRNKLLLVVLLPAIVFIATLSYFLSSLTNKAMTAEVVAHLETAAEASKKHLRGYLAQNTNHLRIITQANRKEIIKFQADPSEDNLNLLIAGFNQSISSMPDINRVCFFEKNGDISASTDPVFIGRNAQNAPFFKSAMITNDISFREEKGELELLVTGPVVEDDRLIGVLALVFSLDGIDEIVHNQAGLGETGEIVLAISGEDDPRFLFEKQTEQITNCVPKDHNDQSQPQPMQASLAGEEKAILNSTDYCGKEVLAVTRLLEDAEIGLVAKIDKEEAFRELDRLLLVRVASTVLMFLIFLLIISIFSHALVKPIANLEKVALLISEGDSTHRAPENKSPDEIGVLSRAFNHMLDKLNQSQFEIKNKVESQTQEIKSKADDLEKQRLAILNVLEDVEAEKKLSESQAQDLKKYEMAVKNASDHIVITDPDGKVLFFNPAAEKITGFSEQEVLGQKVGTKENWGGLMAKEDYEQFWQIVAKDKKVFTGEFTNKRKSGDKYIAQASVAPILNDQGEVVFYVGIERDITKLKEIDRMKTEFISLASHQLRTPLSAIKWFLEMLLAGDAGKLNKEQSEFVNNINDSNERMIDLVNSLLNVSRIESGRIIIDPQPTNLKSLVDQVVLELQPKIKEKGHQIIISAHPDLPDINIDAKLIANVYLNLISNAIKYSPENGEINIFISKKDDQIISQISDNGLGIPKAEQGSLFNKFFRAGNVAKVDTTGNGLGLYLVKAIIDSSGGKIWFESEENKGSAFFFSLPVAGSIAKEGEVSIS